MRKQVNIGINTKSLYFNHSLDSHIAFYNSNAEDASSLLAIGCINELVQETSGALDQLAQFHQKHRDWCFGFLSYDLKNEVEDLSSKLTQTIPFPLLHFFVPRYVIEIFENHVVVHYLPEHNTSEDARKLIDELFVANFHCQLISVVSCMFLFEIQIIQSLGDKIGVHDCENATTIEFQDMV